MFKIRNGCIVKGEDGICYPYQGKPVVPVLIRGDMDDGWRQGEFLMDTGADGTFLHSNEAVRLGLDINMYEEPGWIYGVDGCPRMVYYKRGIPIKLGNFPPILITIGFSPYFGQGLRLLGRNVLNSFGIAFDGKEMGIFTKQEI